MNYEANKIHQNSNTIFLKISQLILFAIIWQQMPNILNFDLSTQPATLFNLDNNTIRLQQMSNSHMRSKQKRDNLSEGGEGVGILMEIEEESIDNVFFWKDNKSWYQEPAFHHFSPQMSRKYSNLQKEINWDQECQSDRIEENDFSEVRSYVHPSQLKSHKKQQNKSECSGLKDIQIFKMSSEMGCKCTKVNCLKRTCGCFDNGKVCGINCICKGCKNVQDNKSMIERAKVEAKLRSNRSIFDNVEHEVPTKVCTCPKSRCQKKYCECYQAGIPCNQFCKCLNCLNTSVTSKQTKYQNGSTIEKSSYHNSTGKEVSMKEFQA